MIHLSEFETKTGGRLDLLDITDDVSRAVAASGVSTGQVLVFVPHTTCSVTVANGSGDLAASIEAEMGRLAPPDGYYQHDDLTMRTENLVEDEPANAPSHIFHIFKGHTSHRLPVEGGKVGLSSGERILLVELCSSRPRRYCVQVLGD